MMSCPGSGMRAGVACACITPPVGISMGGYGFRDHGAEAVADDLICKVLAVEADGRQGAVITADLLWLRREAVDVLKASLAAAYGLDPNLVLITCSHTHSGPQTAPDTPGIGEPDPAYMSQLLATMVSTTGQALADLESVTLATGRGWAGFGVNRRYLVDGRSHFLANPAGPKDDEVLVIQATRPDGSLKGVLFQYACHPTFLADYQISADFPGAAMRRVESLTGAPCLFLQGCCGEVQPNMTRPDGSFRPSSCAETYAAGEQLGDEVIRVLRAGGTAVTPHLAGAIVEIGLPYATLPDKATLLAALKSDQPFRRQWASLMLSHPERLVPAAPFRIQRLDLGEELVLVGLEGEICVSYGFAVKRLAGNRFAVPVGYANGCLGYLPTDAMFAEGGYEVEVTHPYFGLPAAFQPGIEAPVLTALAELLQA